MNLLLRMLLALAVPGVPALAWRDEPPPAARVAPGRDAIEAFACGACHTIPGIRGAAGTAGPSLAGFGRRAYIAGRIPNEAPALARWIADAPSFLPDTAMPDLDVPAADAQAMAAYLLTLR